MRISYSLVWVSPDEPNTVQDMYGDNYLCLEDAKIEYEYLLENPVGDGLDWVPRIMKVTEEFINKEFI